MREELQENAVRMIVGLCLPHSWGNYCRDLHKEYAGNPCALIQAPTRHVRGWFFASDLNLNVLTAAEIQACVPVVDSKSLPVLLLAWWSQSPLGLA